MVQIIAIKSELEFIAPFTQWVFWAEELNTHEIGIADILALLARWSSLTIPDLMDIVQRKARGIQVIDDTNLF